MTISLIGAMAENRVIGKNGGLPWDLPGDRTRFRRLTEGHIVVMGRKTFEAIGKALPNRRNFVLSRSAGARFLGTETLSSLDEFLRLFAASDEEVFVIGGEEIYRLFIPLAASIYLTLVNGNYEGDALFPSLNPAEWREISREPGEKCEYLLLRRLAAFLV